VSGEGNSVTCFSEVSGKKVLEIRAIDHSLKSMALALVRGLRFNDFGAINGLNHAVNSVLMFSDEFCTDFLQEVTGTPIAAKMI
jgi:transcriptional regulator of met regulon